MQHFLKPTTDSKLVIFVDALSVLDYAFKLVNIRVKKDLVARAELQVRSDTECMTKCREETLCSVFTFIMEASASMTNCFLYSFETVLCKTGKCLLLEHRNNFMTQFNIY